MGGGQGARVDLKIGGGGGSPFQNNFGVTKDAYQNLEMAVCKAASSGYNQNP